MERRLEGVGSGPGALAAAMDPNIPTTAITPAIRMVLFTVPPLVMAPTANDLLVKAHYFPPPANRATTRPMTPQAIRTAPTSQLSHISRPSPRGFPSRGPTIT